MSLSISIFISQNSAKQLTYIQLFYSSFEVILCNSLDICYLTIDLDLALKTRQAKPDIRQLEIIKSW